MVVRYFNAYVLFPLLEKKAKRNISSKLNELREFDTLDNSQRDLIRREQFHKILSYSRQHIPYYKDLFEKISFDESKILKDIKFIQDLPVITKEIIRENHDRIRLPGAHHVRKTGGSTGQSVFFFYDDEGLDWTAAANLKAYEMAKNFPHERDCHICSELGVGPTNFEGKLKDWLKLFAQNRKRLMISSFSDSDLQKTYEDLVRIKPYLMQGHPSSGYAIADFIKRKNLKKKRYCTIFEPSGEMLTPKMVKTMEEYLGCKVVNRYGNAEFGVMAHSRLEDSYDKLQVFDRMFIVEEVQNGSIVVSNCTNYSFPLFRYDTGDIGTVTKDSSGCTFIQNLNGRVHDLVNIDGQDYATHFLMDYLDHKIHGIREFQILIKDSSVPTWQIVPERENDKERIRTEILKRWPRGISVEFVEMDVLKRVGWQQKFRHIVDLRTSP